MNQKLLILCLLLVASQAAHALSYSTAERSFTNQVTTLAQIYAGEHEGRAPTSWSDLQPYLDRPIDEAFPHILPTRRYAFLQQPLRLPSPDEGEVVIMTRRPFRDTRLFTNWYGGISSGLREPGRYLIYRTRTGSFIASYVEEAEVQRTFHGSESLLPTPDTEPERRHELEARRWTFVNRAITAFLVIFFARFIYRRLAKRSTQTTGEA